MENNLKSLDDLFQKSFFMVPDYQRGYSWEEKQIREFYEDLILLQNNEEHYTGLLSLEKISDEDMKKDKFKSLAWLKNELQYNGYYIVDGQQRLTTCIIFINEIVSYITKQEKIQDENIIFNKQSIKNIKEKYLYVVDPDSKDIIYSFKFGYLEKSIDEFFKNNIILDKNDSKIEKNLYTNNLQYAKKFFYERIDEIFKAEGKAALEALFKKITQKLLFNLYYLDKESNVYISFESMNNRGKGLSNLELLKNRLIYLCTLCKVKDEVKDVVRKKINNTWKNIYKYLGTIGKERLDDDDYLRAHWIIYFGYYRSKLNKTDDKVITYNEYLLGRYFSQKRLLNINDKDNEAKEEEEEDYYGERELKSALEKKLDINAINKYVESLNDIIYNWYRVKLPDESLDQMDNENKIIQIWLRKIKRLNVGHFDPLISVVLYRNDISNTKKIEFLEVLERYIFIFFKLANHPANINDSHDFNLAHELYLKEKGIDSIIEEYKKIDFMDKNGVIDISNEVLPKFKKNFVNKKGFYSWGNALKYFLLEYDNSKITDENQKMVSPDFVFESKNSIEHIYPEKATYQEWIEAFEEQNEEQKEILKQSLGNLLLLDLIENEKLQNDPYSKKCDRYSIGSQSEIEVSKNYKKWDAGAILKRGLELLAYMEKRWNFKFKDESDKYKLLNLEFMIEKDKELESDYEFEWEKEEKDRKNLTITEENIYEIYDEFKQMYSGNKNYNEIISKLGKTMNKNSVDCYLYALEGMVKGNGFTMGINNDGIKIFLDKIFKEFEDEIKENAVNSVKMYIDYRVSLGSVMTETWC